MINPSLSEYLFNGNKNNNITFAKAPDLQHKEYIPIHSFHHL